MVKKENKEVSNNLNIDTIRTLIKKYDVNKMEITQLDNIKRHNMSFGTLKSVSSEFLDLVEEVAIEHAESLFDENESIKKELEGGL